MVLNNSIKAKNYKCFADAQGLEKIFPINIIIGKNNSGKSSLLDIIDYIIKPNQTLSNIGRGSNRSEIIITDTISAELIEKSIPKGISGGGIPGHGHFEYGMSFLNTAIEYSLASDGNKHIIKWEKEFVDNQENYVGRIANNISVPLKGKIFKRINAERDIRPQGADDTNIKLESNGQGATNVIRRIIYDVGHNPDLIQKNLLEKLNEITNPDIKFTHIQPRKHSNHEWEIYFKDSNGEFIALSKMGSGIKGILLVLLNLLVIPEIESIPKNNLVFAFEELENNLHPSLQKRLFNFIMQYAEQYGSYFFITTHSNVTIDLFGQSENSQIVHIENDGVKSVVRSVQTKFDGRNVLRDLDYKASDILLSNGVIWVEGPSDVIYLELLFDLYKRKIAYNKRLNYCIQSLSTALWKYAGFTDFDWNKIDSNIENKIVSLAKINHNHLIVIDNDGNYDNKKPSEFKDFENGIGQMKARLIYELIKFEYQDENVLESNYGDTKDGRLLFWINDGTFETYLEYFIKNKGNEFKKYFDLKSFRGYFEKKREGSNYSKSKVDLAAEVANFAINNNLDFENFAPYNSPLNLKIQKLFKTVESWNS